MWKASWITRGSSAGVLDQVGVLDDRQRDAGGVGLLEGVGADEVAAHLAGDGHHRDRVHVGVGDAGDQVGGAGAARGQADADLAGRSGVAVGRVRGALLVAHQDVAQLLGVVEGVVERDRDAAGKAEDDLAALVLESLTMACEPFIFIDGCLTGARSLLRAGDEFDVTGEVAGYAGARRDGRLRRPAPRDLLLRDVEGEGACGDVDADGVALLDEADEAAGVRLGRHVADGGAARGAAEAAVGDERHAVVQALAGQRRRGREHLGHAGRLWAPQLRMTTTAPARCGRRRSPTAPASALEDLSGAAVAQHLVGHGALLDDGAVGGEVAEEHGQAAGGVVGAVEGPDHVVVDDAGAGHRLGDGAAGHRAGRAVHEAGVDEPLHHGLHAAGPVQVFHVVLAGGRQLQMCGTRAATSLMRRRSNSRPASVAMAAR